MIKTNDEKKDLKSISDQRRNEHNGSITEDVVDVARKRRKAQQAPSFFSLFVCIWFIMFLFHWFSVENLMPVKLPDNAQLHFLPIGGKRRLLQITHFSKSITFLSTCNTNLCNAVAASPEFIFFPLQEPLLSFPERSPANVTDTFAARVPHKGGRRPRSRSLISHLIDFLAMRSQNRITALKLPRPTQTTSCQRAEIRGSRRRAKWIFHVAAEGKS